VRPLSAPVPDRPEIILELQGEAMLVVCCRTAHVLTAPRIWRQLQALGAADLIALVPEGVRCLRLDRPVRRQLDDPSTAPRAGGVQVRGTWMLPMVTAGFHHTKPPPGPRRAFFDMSDRLLFICPGPTGAPLAVRLAYPLQARHPDPDGTWRVGPSRPFRRSLAHPGQFERNQSVLRVEPGPGLLSWHWLDGRPNAPDPSASEPPTARGVRSTSAYTLGARDDWPIFRLCAPVPRPEVPNLLAGIHRALGQPEALDLWEFFAWREHQDKGEERPGHWPQRLAETEWSLETIRRLAREQWPALRRKGARGLEHPFFARWHAAALGTDVFLATLPERVVLARAWPRGLTPSYSRACADVAPGGEGRT
jgi:hypothetical protein